MLYILRSSNLRLRIRVIMLRFLDETIKEGTFWVLFLKKKRTNNFTTYVLHHHLSYIKIKNKIFKKGVASDCRAHKRFLLTNFSYLCIYVKYLFIIYIYMYIYIYMQIYIYIYIYIIYIYIYIIFIFIHKTSPMHIFVHQSFCRWGECVLVCVYPSVWVYIFCFQFM